MSFKKLFSSIKEARLPYHLSCDEDELNSHVCFDENLCCQAKMLSTFEIPPDSPKGTILDTSPILRKFASHPCLKTPENTSLDHFDRRNVAAQRKKLAKKYFQNGRVLDNPKIRAQSLQRVMPDELCMFSQYKYTARTAKKKCNLNLWFLLEMTKEIYRAQKNHCLHNLIHDFGSLVFEFMFSPMRQLRFHQFKRILESLEDLENTVQDRLNNKHDCKSATGFAAKDQNHRLHFKEDLDKKGDWTQFQAKKMPSSSIVNLIPGIFGHHAVKEHSADFAMKKLPSNADDRVLYEKLAIVLSKAKFLMAQIGHLLHYEQLSSSLSEFLNNKDFRRRSLLGIISTPSRKSKEKPNDSNGFSRCSTTICVNSMPSIDIEEEKQNSMRIDLSSPRHSIFSTRLNNYLFEARSLLEDFDEKVIETRLEKLRSYCVYKAKKWFRLKKKAEVQQKYEKFEIVCKICEQKIQIEKMKEHSKLCCKKAEANKEMRDAEKKLGELVFEAFMKAKELETSLRIDNKNYDKLKVRSRGNTPKALGATAKLINANLIKETSSRSFLTDSPEADTNQRGYFDFLKTNAIRRYNTASLRDAKDTLRRSQTGKSEDLKKCIEELNNSFGPENEDSTPERNQEDMNIDGDDDDANLRKKTYVGRFLEKQNPKCEDNQSTDNSSLPKKKKSPRLELQIYKRGSETNPFVTEGADINYYSEPPKFDLDTENSEDSKGTDESIGSLMIPQLKKSDSCHGSDETPPNPDSPLKIRCKTQTIAPKKSKFYNQTFFNFDPSIHPQGNKKDEAKEEQKIDSTALFPIHSSEAALGSVRTTSSNENVDLLPPLLRTAVKTHSMIVHGENKKNEEELNNIDTKLTEKMIKLRMQINKKKETIKMYEIIKNEAKKMMNKEPYRWKMERDKEDVFTEIISLLAKIEDHEVKSFADNFFKAFDKRLKSGKTYQEAKKQIENPHTKISDIASDTSFAEKTPFVRTRSLMIPPRQSPASRDFAENQPDNLLDRSLTRSQVKLGRELKPNSLSGSLYLDDIDKDFENTDDKSRESRLLSDRSFGKQSGELRGTKFNREDLTPPSPISDISVGCNTYNQLESLRTLGEIDDKYKLQSPFKPLERQHSSETDNPDKTDKENQNLDISLTEVRPSLENDNAKLADFQTMSIASPTKLERMSSLPKEENPNPPSEVKQNIFQLDCSRVPTTAEEQASPETPSFDIRERSSPMIWRTSTAPARQISGFLVGKALPQNNVDLGGIKIVERGNKDSESDGSEIDSESESEEMPLTIISSLPKRDKQMQEEEKNEDEDDDDDDSVIPLRIASRTHTTVGIQRVKPRDLVGISNLRRKLEESKSKSGTSQLSINATAADHNGNHKDGEVTKRSSFYPKEQVFAEDIIEQTEREEKCDSPILESPLLQKGYFSDTQVKNVRVLSKKNQAIGMESFEPVKLISKGAFGRVWLVRRKVTNDLYAMKVINLAERSFKNTQELENLRKENKVFGLAKEDFVVRALFTFIHDTCICFVMEYMIGGDFGDILYTYTALDEDVARFYIAEIVLALEYLHSIGIVHRDLKPDNILLDKHGHAKLTDFGLSETGLSLIIKKALQYEPESPMIQRRMKAVNKLCSGKRELDNKLNLKVKDKLIDRKNDAKSRKEEEKDKENAGEVETSGKKKSKKHQRLIGTPDYMAPEIILGKSITNFSIDWWSLGIMLFEFLCGIPPFNDDTPEKIYENIVKLNIPWDQIKIGYDEDCMSPEAADLIKNLLVLDHTQRLGANGADEIKKHPFFKGINWETLRKETAKIIPEQTNETDTTNFIRMNSRINEKEKVNPFEPSELTKTSSNVKDAKEFLEASVDKFDMFNYVALNSDNLKNVDETLKEKERILDELKKGCDDKENKKMYDDIFDTPK